MPTGTGVNKDLLAFLQPGYFNQHLPGRQRDQVEGCGLFHGDVFRFQRECVFVYRNQLGERAYPTVLDVVDASRRGIAMAVLYFVANVIGGGAGTLLTGALSDRFARQIMQASEVTEMSKIKGEGLNLALQYTVPGGILLGGFMMLLALHYYSGTRVVSLART